jgi:UDP-N-acetyl-D-galactosamine dehydrogenase
MLDKLMSNKAVICVMGLGYVGLPLAEAFSASLKVIGFDINSDRIRKLNQNNDNRNLIFTANPEDISRADFIIICVPTPVTKSKDPDLSYVKKAAEIAGRHVKKGSVIILESTVYPGVTEEIVKPILEESGLKCGLDFKIAYSPERMNPGDEEHTIDKTTKVIASMDEETTELVSQLYRKVTPSIYRARDIKTAEAAKVIENIQRDLNIALMNELAIIFEKMGLSTKDVLDTAATKWNFHRYSPGLVGGHCIPVDPYYLVYKAMELDYHPQVILAGRATNDFMPAHVAEMTIKALNSVGKVIKGSKALILGLTYKPDVPDIREAPVQNIIRELREYQLEIFGLDPLLDIAEVKDKFQLRLLDNFTEAKRHKFDCIILAVAHSAFRRFSLADLKALQNQNPILIDVPGMFEAGEAERIGFYYQTL